MTEITGTTRPEQDEQGLLTLQDKPTNPFCRPGSRDLDHHPGAWREKSEEEESQGQGPEASKESYGASPGRVVFKSLCLLSGCNTSITALPTIDGLNCWLEEGGAQPEG